ncbi:MAG: hemolysin family protein [Fimbriimonas sp.]
MKPFKRLRPKVVGFARVEQAAVAVLSGLILLLWVVGDKVAEGRTESSAPGYDYMPLMGGWLFVVLVLAIVAINACFIAAETAVDLLTSLHVKHAPNEKATLQLQDVLDNQQKYGAACSLGSQLARIGLVFAGFVFAQDLANVLLWKGDGDAPYNSILLAAALLAIPLTLVNLVLGELVPKSYASIHVSSVAARMYGFIKIISLALSIPAGMVVGLANLLSARFGGRATFSMADAAEEQIKNIVEEAQESGEIEGDERELLHSVFEFTDTVVREVMTPRVDLEGMPVESEPSEVARVIEASGHSRIPLFEETDDQIVGIIHAKDLLLAMVDGKQIDLRQLMRPALYVPENMNLHEAMTEMRLHRAQMAIVQDEFGGTAGIVTIEDIVEELVGDIVDEYDTEEPALVKTEDGYLVDGKTHVDDVNEAMGTNFASDEFDTIGGFVFGLFGKQPKEGESIESDDHRFTVAETDGRRILRLAITPALNDPASG